MTEVKHQRRVIAKSLALISCALLFALGTSSDAQQPKTVFRIGHLSSADRATESTRADAIRLALREVSYIEGQNIAIEYRYADGKIDRFPELATELVGRKVDLVVAAGGANLIRAAKNATNTIPIVMVGAGVHPFVPGFVV